MLSTRELSPLTTLEPRGTGVLIFILTHPNFDPVFDFLASLRQQKLWISLALFEHVDRTQKNPAVVAGL